ncbi:integrase, catalytic region, zinc finger, CCHC-type containing protein [Tanacetum coccineum]
MHNNIMAAGSKDRPPMLVTGTYAQQRASQTNHTESASEEDNDPEQAQRDKDMQKYLALIAKYFKKIYKPTNNNLKTSSNSRNKNVDTSLRYKNDNQTGHFGNQRTVTVVGARETVGSQVVQQTGIQCFSCKESGHFAKDYRKPKRVKDYSCHKEKMLLCKQAKKGVPLHAEQADWLEDMDEEIYKQELEAHYNYMHSKQLESISKTCIVEKVDSNVIPDSLDMCDNDIQTNQNAEDECAALANLIVNLTLDTEEHKKIFKKLKKANSSLTQELKECKSNLEESNTTRDSFLIVLQSKQTEHETYKTLNDCLVKEKTKVITDLKLTEEKDIEEMISMEKQLKFLNEIVYKRNQSIQTIHMLAHKGSTFNDIPTFVNPMYLKKDQSEKPCLYEILYDTSDPENRFIPDREKTLTLEK